MLWTALGGVALATVLIFTTGWGVRRYLRQRRELETARQRGEFSRRREWLEAKFLKTAAGRGTPRGLEWVDCDFGNEISFARDRRSGELTALVAVGIRFRAIEGGGMEDVEAVANQKAATALFRYRDGVWSTDGRAIFNLNPLEAIQFYEHELERVE